MDKIQPLYYALSINIFIFVGPDIKKLMVAHVPRAVVCTLTYPSC